MARKINPDNSTWEELGMKPGIRVPGTAKWMTEWRRQPNQKKMINYASAVHLLAATMPEKDIGFYLKKYLSGKWDPEDELTESKIAAAIRRSPQWEVKYNLMEEHYMSKKQADVAKKAGKKAEGASLKERIEALEAKVEILNEDLVKLTHIRKDSSRDRKHTKPEETTDQPMDAEIKIYLKNLEAAKETGDNKKAAMIRGKLRKKGYSLRANGKK